MNFLEHFRLIERLHKLIRIKSTGDPKQLANKLNISRASVFRHLNFLKELGAIIKYSHIRESYFYEVEFDFHSALTLRV